MYWRLRANLFCHNYNRCSCIVLPGHHRGFRIEPPHKRGQKAPMKPTAPTRKLWSDYSVVHSRPKTPKMALMLDLICFEIFVSIDLNFYPLRVIISFICSVFIWRGASNSPEEQLYSTPSITSSLTPFFQHFTTYCNSYYGIHNCIPSCTSRPFTQSLMHIHAHTNMSTFLRFHYSFTLY